MSVTQRIGTVAAAAKPVAIETLEARALFTAVAGDYHLLEGFGLPRTGTVTLGSAKDSYHFQVAHTSTFTANLAGAAGDADLYLYASDHTTLIASSTNGGTTDDNINQTLASGNYYIDVVPFAGTRSYTLLSDADTAGNSLADARDLGNLKGLQTLRDGVGNDTKNPSDINDYYKITVQQPGQVKLGLSFLQADADLDLYNSSGGFLATSAHGGTTDESIDMTLQPGVYYALVTKFGSGFTNYTLSYSGPADLAGNSRTAAKSLGAVPPTRTVSDFVGDFDTDDFYKFTVAAGKTIHLVLSGLSQDADLSLLKSDGTVASLSTHGGTTNETIDYHTTSGGTFYARVYRFSTFSTSYSLTLS